ncbi:hypothetical protein ACFL1Z_00605 [Thermodesulfobacteriota bacterium]
MPLENTALRGDPRRQGRSCSTLPRTLDNKGVVVTSHHLETERVKNNEAFLF